MWLFRKREGDEEEYEDDDDEEEYEDDDEEEDDDNDEYSDDHDDEGNDDLVDADNRANDSEPNGDQKVQLTTNSSKRTALNSEQTSGEDTAAPSPSDPKDAIATISSSGDSNNSIVSNSTEVEGNGVTTHAAVKADKAEEKSFSEKTSKTSVAVEGDEEEEEDDEEEEQPNNNDEIENKGSEEEEEAMSTEEKQGLLALAAEHDRVDIIKSILTEQEVDRETLLHSGIPPLHTAVSFGSTNATQCLLRMGADPSIRPNVAQLKEQGLTKSANVNRYDGVSAWELVFGRDASTSTVDGTDVSLLTSAEAKRKYGPVKPVNMAPSKREGIRHAFTAEALRCLGSDEVHRLDQLLKSGMPFETDIGGKNLYEWAKDMGALECQKLIRPSEHDNSQATVADNDEDHSAHRRQSAVLDRTTTPGEESVSQLINRLVELDSLARALSSCLDNLAEEVSVCHGLLLMGGGASALAAHVRSLKDLQARQSEDLERCLQEWDEIEDELAYWLKEAGDKCDDIKAMISPVDELTARKDLYPTPQGPVEEEAQRRQLLAQIAASEHKVRKLRASIYDLSEESARDLKEVERRGLTGGIKLVRGLREKLREIEFHQVEAKNGIASCRAKMGLIQARLHTSTVKQNEKEEPSNSSNGGSTICHTDDEKKELLPVNPDPVSSTANGLNENELATPMEEEVDRQSKSITDLLQDYDPSSTFAERIAKGHSDAIAVRSTDGRGFFPVDLWEIFLRIIGLGRVAAQNSAESFRQSTSHVMIV